MKRKILVSSGLLLVLLLMQVAGQPPLPHSFLTSTQVEAVSASSTRQAPTPIINKTFGTLDTSDYGMDVIECSSGGYALAGYTSSYGAISHAGWLIRTDENGNHLWNYTYGGASSDYIHSLTECSDGGFALAGYTYSFGVAGQAFWLVRVDSNGNHLWNKTYDTPNDDLAWDVVEVSSGGFALAGSTSDGFDYDFWLVRTDTNGNHEWNETYGGTYNDQAYSLIEVSTGDFLLAGYTRSYGPGVPSTPSRIYIPSNLWLVYTNGTGTMQWHKTYHAGGDEFGWSVEECQDGGFAIGGYCGNFFTGEQDFWLIRTDNIGDHLWNETYGWTGSEEICRNMVIYSSGGFALVGTTNHTSDGLTDIWLVLADSSGNQIWNETYGSSEIDWCYGLADCSLGLALYGTPHILYPVHECHQGWFFVIPDQVAPTWDPAPADQTILYGVPFSYDLNAADPWPLAWVINDTTNFAIDSDGVVTNTVLLAVGIYSLRVTVSDPASNTLIGTFLVTVIPAPQSPLLLIIGAAVVAIVVVCLIIYFWRRSGKSK